MIDISKIPSEFFDLSSSDDDEEWDEETQRDWDEKMEDGKL